MIILPSSSSTVIPKTKILGSISKSLAEAKAPFVVKLKTPALSILKKPLSFPLTIEKLVIVPSSIASIFPMIEFTV